MEQTEEKIQAAKTRFGANLSAKRYLNDYCIKKWTSKHAKQPISDCQTVTQKHKWFAAELFKSWDKSGRGLIHEKEVIKPLVSLGLAFDSKCSVKVWRALKLKRNLNKPVEIGLSEFLGILDQEPAMAKLMLVCPKGSLQEKMSSILQLWKRLSRGFDVEIEVVKQWLLKFQVAQDAVQAG